MIHITTGLNLESREPLTVAIRLTENPIHLTPDEARAAGVRLIEAAHKIEQKPKSEWP